MNRNIIIVLLILAALVALEAAGVLLSKKPANSLCFSYLPCEGAP